MYDDGIMSITWGVLQSDKKSIFLGFVYLGVGTMLNELLELLHQCIQRFMCNINQSTEFILNIWM